jgi:hypothetical protein
LGVGEKVGLAKGALDQFDAAVAPLFDRQLEQMGLSESQVEQQDLAQLETTLEKVNNAIDNSGSLMKFRVRLTAEAGAVITQGPDYHYEVSILPVLVTRKGRVLERIKALRPDPADPGRGPAPASGTPAGSQEIRSSRDAFASGRDFTIINYFGTGQGALTGADEATADADSERNEPGAHPRSDSLLAARTAQPEPDTREPDQDALEEEKAGTPEVSMEAGIAYARIAAQLGHPPHTVTRGRPTPDQPLDYLLGKTAQAVWEAASSAQSAPEPNLLPLRNYLGALISKIGVTPARDFAVGVLTERVRQEEDVWPDQPGDAGGKRSAHGTGAGHLCLLESKHQVETAIYAVPAGLA